MAMDLYDALWQSNFKRVKELVEGGIVLNTDEYWSPLFIAAFVGEIKIVKYLLAHGARPTLQTINQCVRYECAPHIFKRLLKTGIDVNQNPEILINAARDGRYRLTSRLLESGANPNIPDAGGTTALMMAAYYAHIGIMERLFAYGADVNRRDDNGENALFYAVAWAAPLSVFKWLVEHGIDLNVRTKKEKMTILQWMRHPEGFGYNPNNEIDR